MKYSAEKNKRVTELMAAGKTDAEVCADLEISYDTLYRWCKEKPLFLKAYKKGEVLRDVWRERFFLDAARDDKVNASMTIYFTKARWHWKEPSEVNVVVQDAIPEEAKTLIDRIRGLEKGGGGDA
jgi:hypothetical protein